MIRRKFLQSVAALAGAVFVPWRCSPPPPPPPRESHTVDWNGLELRAELRNASTQWWCNGRKMKLCAEPPSPARCRCTVELPDKRMIVLDYHRPDGPGYKNTVYVDQVVVWNQKTRLVEMNLPGIKAKPSFRGELC